MCTAAGEQLLREIATDIARVQPLVRTNRAEFEATLRAALARLDAGVPLQVEHAGRQLACSIITLLRVADWTPRDVTERYFDGRLFDRYFCDGLRGKIDGPALAGLTLASLTAMGVPVDAAVPMLKAIEAIGYSPAPPLPRAPPTSPPYGPVDPLEAISQRLAPSGLTRVERNAPTTQWVHDVLPPHLRGWARAFQYTDGRTLLAYQPHDLVQLRLPPEAVAALASRVDELRMALAARTSPPREQPLHTYM